MGGSASSVDDATPVVARGYGPADDIVVDRATSTLEDKEVCATLRMMQEHAECKMRSSEDPELLAEVLRRDDDTVAHVDDPEYEQLEVPVDDQGYAVTCSLDRPEELLEFFDRYGFVVVDAGMSEEDLSRSVDELWAFVSRQSNGRIDREDPSTWEKWLSLGSLGFLGMTPNLTPQLCRNRTNETVHLLFATLLGSEQLIVNLGRSGLMRPTRDVPWPENNDDGGEAGKVEKDKTVVASAQPRTVVDKPEWKTRPAEEWVHWDLNPFTGAATSFSFKVTDPVANRGYDTLNLQGILALCDCGPDDGGFFCVPGAHRNLRGWAARNTDSVGDDAILAPESTVQVYVPAGDPLRQAGRKVPLRAGSLVVWSSALPHCNFPNDSPNFRMVQYIKMIRADNPGMTALLNDPALLPPDDEYELTDFRAKLMGIEPWA
eukprot:m.476350 g.476350  ORF g.476350 m.476350 type:complete len:432 (-) comp20506_c1_seq1:42-1337(-)